MIVLFRTHLLDAAICFEVLCDLDLMSENSFAEPVSLHPVFDSFLLELLDSLSLGGLVDEACVLAAAPRHKARGVHVTGVEGHGLGTALDHHGVDVSHVLLASRTEQLIKSPA